MKKGAIALMLAILFQLVPVTQAQQSTSPATTSGPFVDVTDPTVYDYAAIKYLKENNVVQGYAGGYFYPQNPIARSEFVKIIAAAQGLPLKETKCGFSDVDEKHWAAQYICAAKKAGWVSGYSDGTFRLNETITASEASKILVNAYKIGTQTDPSIWYKGYFTALAQKKALPLSVEYFDQKLTRSDMAMMTYRLKANVTNEASRTYDEIDGKGFVKPSSCQELQDRLFYPNDKINYFNRQGAKDGSSNGVATPVAAESGGGGGGGYSTTNIQVPGVDEADMVKTDGDKIYMLKNDTVRVIQAVPVEGLKELVRMKLGNENETFYPTEMYLNAKQLILIGNAYISPVYTDEKVAAGYPAYTLYDRNSKTRVYMIDVSDPKAPTISRTIDFEAYAMNSRRIDNNLYLTMSQYVNRPYPYPYPGPYYYEKAAPGITAPYPYPYPVPTFDPEELMPRMKDSKDAQEKDIAQCGDVLVFPKGDRSNFLIVAGIPLNDTNKEVSRQVLVGNSDNLFVSDRNMFVTDVDWTGGFQPADTERVPYLYYPAPEKTAVYKFGLSNGNVQFIARGNVMGRVLDQFSMDEHAGNFRIATTSTSYYPVTKTLNHVYILDKDMNISGKIEDLAPGETIYSTRFMGDRGYVVTFRQVDPLFALDLSDPTKPVVGGSLKIEGYSSYLHPYDENHIIGFGNEVDPANGAFTGLKMSLFDVTNIKNPKEMFTERIGRGGTTSDVLYNHKALLFDKEKNLLSFPVTVYDSTTGNVCSDFKYSTCPASCQKICVPTNCTTSNGIQVCTTDCDGANSCVAQYGTEKAVFQGAYVYTIDLAKGFTLKGKTTNFTAEDIKAGGEYWYPDYNKSIQRILYIGDNLYTISLSVIKALSIADLSEKKSATLSE